MNPVSVGRDLALFDGGWKPGLAKLLNTFDAIAVFPGRRRGAIRAFEEPETFLGAARFSVTERIEAHAQD